MRHVLTASVALAVLAVSFLPASAHFMWLAADDPVNLWLGRQHSVNGSFCCNQSDAYLYDGAYTLNADGSITIPLDGGGAEVVAPGKIVRPNPNDPNPTGGAVWWHGPDGNTYCFAIGLLT